MNDSEEMAGFRGRCRGETSSASVISSESDAHNPLSRPRTAAYRGHMTDQRPDDTEPDAPLGGDETTEDQLEADNPAEEDTLATLDPDAPPA